MSDYSIELKTILKFKTIVQYLTIRCVGWLVYWLVFFGPKIFSWRKWPTAVLHFRILLRSMLSSDTGSFIFLNHNSDPTFSSFILGISWSQSYRPFPSECWWVPCGSAAHECSPRVQPTSAVRVLACAVLFLTNNFFYFSFKWSNLLVLSVFLDLGLHLADIWRKTSFRMKTLYSLGPQIAFHSGKILHRSPSIVPVSSFPFLFHTFVFVYFTALLVKDFFALRQMDFVELHGLEACLRKFGRPKKRPTFVLPLGRLPRACSQWQAPRRSRSSASHALLWSVVGKIETCRRGWRRSRERRFFWQAFP